jgi:hypothetical protein
MRYLTIPRSQGFLDENGNLPQLDHHQQLELSRP